MCQYRRFVWMLPLSWWHTGPSVPTQTTLIKERVKTLVYPLSLNPSPPLCFFIYGPQRLWSSKHAMMAFYQQAKIVLESWAVQRSSLACWETPAEGRKTASAFLCRRRPELSNSFVLCKILPVRIFSWIKHVEHKVLEMSKHYLLILRYITWDKKPL